MEGLICCRCHAAPRISAGYCKPCYNAWRREWRKKNIDKVKAQELRGLARDPERRKRYDRKSYWQHREKRIAKSRRWNVENKEAFAAREAARRAAQKAATPSWADWGAIEAVYVAASERSSTSGVPHHVDHIVPLISKKVCGLHVSWNLAVLPALENQSKGNRVWPDMP